MLCPLCNCVVSAENYISHLNKNHRQRKNVSLSCVIGGLKSCKIFNSVTALTKHYYKWHHVREPPSASPSASPPASPLDPPAASPPASPLDPPSASLPAPPLTPPSASPPPSASLATSLSPSHSQPAVVSDSQCNQDEPNINLVSVSAAEESARVEVSVPTVSRATSEQGRRDPDSDYEDNDENFEDVSDESEDELAAVFRKPSKQHQIDFSEVNESAADLLLFLKSKGTVPQSAIDGVQQKCENLVRNQLSKFVELITLPLHEQNIDLGAVINIDNAVDSCSQVFTGLNTKWKQDKYFKHKYKIVQPLRYFVGRNLKRKRQRKTGRRKNVLVENSLVFNSISKFIEKIVDHPDFDKITDPSLFSSDPSVIDSFTKGERFKKSKFFKKFPNAIRLVLYYDEFDSCDAIASKAGVHKLGAFYLGVDNIHPKYRSKLDFISLVALCKASTIKDVGMDIILKPILKELKKLEKGIVLENGRTVHASLIATIGDNLGIHALCGFKEGFTARRTCHHCMVTQEELHTITKEREDLLRTVPMYEKQIETMKAAGSKRRKEELSTDFGLNSECSLNQLDTFHVIGSIVADIMHDELEGCLHLQLKNLLHHLTSGDKPVMTLDWLNEVLLDFDFDYTEASNKPSLIRKNHVEDKDGKLHQNSSQTFQLAMFLPLILGPHVSTDDPHWENFIMLIEICKVIFASEINLCDIDELADTIELYLSSFQKLYRELIPKQHFMVHYPRLIRENGPLTLFSCMRMEAFHRNFKRKAYSLGNYINIESSLAKSYALDQAVLLSGSLMPVVQYGPVNMLKLQDRPYRDLLTGSENVLESSWVKNDGLTIIPDRCFLAYSCDEFMLKFALVKYVVIWPELLLVCQKAETLSFNPNFNAYEIKLLEPLIVLKPSQVLGHSVFHLHPMLQKNWIVTMYSINGCF